MSRALLLPSTAGVYCIYGSLGGGKTLSAVCYAIQFLRRRDFVITNIQLHSLSDREKSHYTFLSDISKVDWFSLPLGSPRGSGGRKRVAIILDELPELLNQYVSGKEIWVQTFLSWLRHTSKNGQYVFFIAQHPSFILKSARLLCSYFIRCDDFGQYHLPGFRIRVPFAKNYVSRRIYDIDDNCLNHIPDLVSKTYYGQFYDTSQGLSLYRGNSVSSQAVDPYESFERIEASYTRLYRFSLLSFAFLFLGLFLIL